MVYFVVVSKSAKSTSADAGSLVVYVTWGLLSCCPRRLASLAPVVYVVGSLRWCIWPVLVHPNSFPGDRLSSL